MSRSAFFSLFVLMNLLLVFVKIYQHNSVIKTSFEKQKVEIQKNKLLLSKDELLMKLLKLKSPSLVATYAKEKLDLQEIKLSQIKKLEAQEEENI